MPNFIEGCDEHKIPLVDGRCPCCKDAHGNSFVLDMQSKCLLERDEPGGFYCMNCGEVLRTKDNLSHEEMQDAMAGFMVEHVEKHGGDVSKVFFSFPAAQ